MELGKKFAILGDGITNVRAFERTFLAGLEPRDARRLGRLLNSRVESTDLLRSHTDQQRAEVRSWFTRRDQATVDLVQGPRQAHLITCRPAREPRIDVAPVHVARDEAQEAVGRLQLAADTGTPASDEPAITRLVDAVRDHAAGAGEIALRLRAPWESIPVENIPDSSGQSLSGDQVVVRTHSARPRFRAATERLPRNAEVLGDPMGSTQGSCKNAI